MVREKKSSGTVAPKKTKSSGTSRTKGKVSQYNRFMKAELARLKEESPEMKHAERFKFAASNWAKSKENPKAGAK